MNGSIITEAIYEDIEALDGAEGYLIIKEDGKQGVISNSGNIILESKYDNITSNGKYVTAKLNKKQSKFSFEGVELTSEEVKQLDDNNEVINTKDDIQDIKQINGWELKKSDHHLNTMQNSRYI